MIVYIDNSKVSTEKLLELITVMQSHKIRSVLLKSILFLYMNSLVVYECYLLEIEIKNKTVLLKIIVPKPQKS